MITVACVYRTGGIYTWQWVQRLERQVRAHVNEPIRFLCLTDDAPHVDERIQQRTLKHHWPGWWSKIALFEPGHLTNGAVYLDLDSLVVGDLGPIIDLIRGEERCFWAVPDFHRAGWLNSSVMAWRGDYSAIWRGFLTNPDRIMHEYEAPEIGGNVGDQAFIEDTLALSGVGWRELHGVASYKLTAVDGPPPWASVVTFHGRPKMHELNGWVAKQWAGDQ